jgi:tetratricopeptide (TPR) repeat protein
VEDLSNNAARAGEGGGPGIWKGWTTALILCLLLWICYSNSFRAPWQYDDEGNILKNAKVHMSQWSWDQIRAALTAGHDFQTISRPLAYLSFALNHRLGGLNTFGYHLVNFAVHCLATVFLFLLIRDTLTLPILKGRYDDRAGLIAFIAALLWAIHPIQVSAVTYIVQRMASMAGMFYVAAMYWYLKARTGRRSSMRRVFFILCAVSSLLALLTKENSLLLFYSLLLYELVLLQGVCRRSVRAAVFWAIGITAGMIVIGSLYTDVTSLFKPYEIRPFNMLERVLTQPRVLFFYLSLIAVPMTSRMAILHDIEISRALWTPWTTSVAMAALLGSVIILLAVSRRYPLLSFCGLFFFLNHAVEGSVLNLELIYEHRNYIPSMLLFVPIAIAAVKSYDYFSYRRAFQRTIAATILLFLVSQSYTTWTYNRVFQSELSLWLHAAGRSPGLSVVRSNLGNVYWAMGLREQALKQFLAAHELNRFNNSLQRGHLLYNLGLYEAHEKKSYDKALEWYKKAIDIYNGSPKVWYEVVRTLTLLAQYREAQNRLNTALDYWPENSKLHYLQSVIHAKDGNCKEALEAARKALALDPGNTPAMMVVAGSYHCMGELQQAVDTWEHFLSIEDRSLVGILSIIDLFIVTGNDEKAQPYYGRLLQMAGNNDLETMLDLAGQEGILLAYTPDRGRLADAFRQWQQ